LPSPMPRKCP